MTPPRLAPDAPLFIVINAASGKRNADDAMAVIAAVLDEAGRAHSFARIDDIERMNAVIEGAVADAAAANGAVVVAGGDGTINAVAQAVLGSGRPLGVLPQGTFNYFCRTHGMPLDTEQATRALLRARVRPVQVGLVNERVFLVNASLGLYPQLLEDREAFKRRHERSQFNAFRSGVLTLMRHHRQLRLEIENEDGIQDILTPTLFVGNNPLQLEQIGIPEAQAVGDGDLAAIRLRPTRPAAMFWLLLLVLLGRLGDAENVISFSFRKMTVRPPRRVRRMKVAVDGEIFWMDTPLHFRVAPEPLYTLIADEDPA
jgi:diacylglycerol kinase family enzyme